MRITLFSWVLCLGILACSPGSRTEVKIPLGEIQEGPWLLTLQLNDSVALPVNLEMVNDTSVVFINGEERLTATVRFLSQDSLHIIMPYFETGFQARIGQGGNRLDGRWYNYAKEDYFIPFSAQSGLTDRFCSDASETEISHNRYEIHFSPESVDHYPALGLFKVEPSGVVLGTFATETGDYRFLQGGVCEGRLQLSCFDGSHAFLFNANLSGDSLIDGQFYSGNHWNEPWQGRVNPNYELRDPYTLTEVIDTSALGLTRFIMENGSNLTLNEVRTPGEVSIIQIMGSWCPNCLDESRFFKSLYEEYHSMGLSILPLSFESSAEVGPAYAAIHKLERDLDLPFPIYLGGSRKKSSASEAIPALNHVMSFPTTIFIDRQGKVRQVHTGFYGPSTGAYYDRYMEMAHALIRTMLSES
jgi:thiol-disulfide isomerase/thioredoxin